MIKRQYFIYAEVSVNDRTTKECFRQFFFWSLFPNPDAAIRLSSRAIAKESDVDESQVMVKAFNRC